ncbi:MAG: 30S ribosomal protein S11 [Deltaproteobacteria bacterium]|nr:30S ribosomal protein S11 [Deltaproteobacteria bacterium]
MAENQENLVVEKEKKRIGPSKKKKVRRVVSSGVVHVKATFNNTIISVTDPQGQVISWASAGLLGFKGARKSTPYAAGLAAKEAVKKAVDQGVRSVIVRVKGPGAGRESALRALQSGGLRVSTIEDVTPIPHNGCRPPKRRRI